MNNLVISIKKLQLRIHKLIVIVRSDCITWMTSRSLYWDPPCILHVIMPPEPDMSAMRADADV